MSENNKDTNLEETVVENATQTDNKAKKEGKLKAVTKSRNFKHGSMSTIFVVAVVIVAILVNVLATALTQKFPSLNLDLTTESKLTLSDTSYEIASNITEDVTIYFLVTQSFLEDASIGYGAEGVSMSTLAAKLSEASNGKIKVEYVDFEANPSFRADYDEDLYTSDVIVQSAKRYKVLDINSDLLYYNSTDKKWYSKVDQGFASALLAVTSEKLPIIGVTSGHQEVVATDFEDYITSNNFEVEKIDMLTATEIDPSIDVLFINAPIYDFTEEQIAILDKFLDNDGLKGKHIIYTASAEAKDTTNLNVFLADWGIGLSNDKEFIVETDESRYSGHPIYPLLQVSQKDTGLLSGLLGSKKPALGAAAVAMEQLWENKSGYQTEVILSTYDTATKIKGDQEVDFDKLGDLEKDSYPYAIYSSTGVSYDSKYVLSSVTAFASQFPFEKTSLTQGNILNSEIILKIFRINSGTTGNENAVYIAPKNTATANTTISTGDIITYGLVIFTITIPVLILAFGVIVWIRRRHL